jgi:hypothetical protein
MDPEAFGFREAQHLLNRLGFGADAPAVDELVEMGLEAAVDLLLDFDRQPEPAPPAPAIDPDVISPPTDLQRLEYRRARESDDREALDRFAAMRRQRRKDDREQFRELSLWWLKRMCLSPRAPQEKLTLFWHGHFASSYRSVRDSYLMFRQNRMFREHAAGSFARLARSIIRDPAMIRYLDNHRNVKSSPNENLARELMELFTLGEGNYREADIRQGARALSGYHYEDNDFVFRMRRHDAGPKRILGRQGRFNGDDFVKILLSRRECAEFVAFKLYDGFVRDLPDGPDREALGPIRWLAGRLRDADYELRPTLRLLFTRAFFYSDRVVGQKIKSPAQLIAGAVRVLQPSAPPWRTLGRSMSAMGQTLFMPPSVAGWDGGPAWISTSTLFLRQNLLSLLVSGEDPRRRRPDPRFADYDGRRLLEGASSSEPADLTDRLVDRVIGAFVPANRRRVFLDLAERQGSLEKPENLRAMLVLLTAAPEYQLC